MDLRRLQGTGELILMNVGILGLGIVGSRVAANYRAAGFPPIVWSRTKRDMEGFVDSPALVAKQADVIQIFVNDATSLLAVMREMEPQLSARHTIVNSSTVSLSGTLEAAAIAQAKGAAFLDCPFTGSRDAAAAGKLVYYVGGDSSVLDRVTPILNRSAREIIPMGKIGDATVLKIATNMVTATTVQALAEAMAITAEAGIPLEKFLQATEGNANCSGLARMKIPSMTTGDFTPHFSLKNMLKDARYALELAAEHGLDLPALSAATACMQDQADAGQGENDFSVLVTKYGLQG